jgi:hypothetical protein
MTAMSKESDADSRKSCMTDLFWAMGRRTESDAMLEQVKAKSANSNAVGIAESFALRNDKDNAYKWLERAYDNREPAITVIGADPLLRNLRGDSRFRAILRKMKVPE